MIEILSFVPKQNRSHIICLMSNGVIQLKGHYISLTIALIGVENVKTTYRKSWPENLFLGVFFG